MLSIDKRKALFASGDDASVRAALSGSLRRGAMSLKGLGLESLPEQLADYAEEVTSLDLTDNTLKELPAAIGALWGLERLVLTKNAWRGFPDVIFELANLSEVIGAPGFARGARRSDLEAFLRHTGNLPPAERRALFQIHTSDELASVTPSQLAAGLLGTLPSLYERCAAALLARSKHQPMEPGAELTVLGSVRFKKTELKKALQKAGVSYSANPTPTTTHVVLGRSPKNQDALLHLNGRRLTFLSEEDALRFIDARQADTRFLAQATPEAAAHGENLRAMLTSGEKASVDLALTLISKGGLPSEAATALFLMAKEEPDQKHRAKARKLLKRHGSAAIQAALADRSAMAYRGDKAEAKTTASLTSYARQAPELDWIWMARHLHTSYGHGLRFVLQNADPATRLEVLREHIEHNALNFHRVYSPNYRPRYENAYAYYDGQAAPDYLYGLTELTALDLSWCRFDTLPPGISALTRLKRIDLTGNMFTQLPPELLTMPSLQEIWIGVNQLATFPTEVTALPGLLVLDVQGNRRQDQKHLYEPLEAPDDVRDALPRCRIIDGLTSAQQQHMSYYT